MRHHLSRRRLFGVGATVIGLSLAVAACTPSQDGGGGTSEGAESGTVTVWHYYSVDNQNAMLDSYKETFEAAHPGVTVENVYVPQDQLNSKLVAAAGAGTGPDVVVFDGYSATTLIAGGALAPLDSYWADFEGASQIAPGAIASVDGKKYSVQGYVNTLALYYNKTILDEVGVEPPTTMDELEADLKLVTDAGHQGIVLAGQPDVQGAFQAYPWLTAEGFTYEDPKAEPLVKAFTRVRGWIDSGYLSQQASTWDQNVPFTEFLLGDIAFSENGNWQLATLASDAEFEYGVVPLPVGDSGKIYLGGEAQAIGAQSANPDLAWKYLSETFYSKDGQLTALSKVGSIPTRDDAAADPSISSDPYLSQFAAAISTQGAPFPDTAIPPANNEATILANGQAWSAALGGQTSAQDATDQFLSQLDELLAK